MEHDDAIEFLEGVSSANAATELAARAEYLTFRHRLATGEDARSVISRIDAFLARHPDSRDACAAAFKKARIYHNYLDDPDKGAALLREVTAKYAEPRGVVNLARALLSDSDTALASELSTLVETEDLLDISISPNPFNPSTTISFSLPKSKKVALIIYSALGQQVKTLIEGSSLNAGSHRVAWDGTDETGNAVASGSYIAVLQTGDSRTARSMIMLK